MHSQNTFISMLMRQSCVTYLHETISNGITTKAELPAVGNNGVLLMLFSVPPTQRKRTKGGTSVCMLNLIS